MATQSEDPPVLHHLAADRPIGEGPVGGSPVDDSPVDDSPVEGSTVGESSVDENSVDDSPTLSGPFADLSVADRPADRPVSDRPAGRSLDLAVPPHHATPDPDDDSTPSPSTPVPSSAFAVPRSSSFTRNKRFLTGEGLSAREALGIIDDPNAPAVQEVAPNGFEAFHLALAALSSVLCYEDNKSPPPPPEVSLSEEQEKALAEGECPTPPSFGKFVKRLNLPNAALIPARENELSPKPQSPELDVINLLPERIPAHAAEVSMQPDVSIVAESLTTGQEAPVQASKEEQDKKGHASNIVIHKAAEVAKMEQDEVKEDTEPNAMLSTAVEPPRIAQAEEDGTLELQIKVSVRVQTLERPSSEKEEGQEEQNKVSVKWDEPKQIESALVASAETQSKPSATLESPRHVKSALEASVTSESKNKLSLKLQSPKKHAKSSTDDSTDSKPKLSLGKLSIGSDKGKRKGGPLSPLLGGALKRKSGRFFASDATEEDNLDDVEAPTSPIPTLSLPGSRTVSRLRGIFASRLSGVDAKTTGDSQNVKNETAREKRYSQRSASSEGHRVIVKEEKMFAGDENSVSQNGVPQGPPSTQIIIDAKPGSTSAPLGHKASASDDSVLSDVADEIVKEKEAAPVESTSSSTALQSSSRGTSNFGKEAAAEGSAVVGTEKPGPVAISLPARNDQPLQLHQLSADTESERFADANEEQIPFSKSDSLRKRRDFFKRFRAVPEGPRPSSTGATKSEQQSLSPTEPSSPSTPLERAREKPLSENTTPPYSQLGRRRVEVVLPRVSMSDDTVSYTSANDDFSPPPSREKQNAVMSDMAEKAKATLIQDKSPARLSQTFQNSPTVESVTTSSSAKSREYPRGADTATVSRMPGGSNVQVAASITKSSDGIMTETSKPLNHFGIPLPQTEPNGVSAHAFMDGPISEPVHEETTRKAQLTRKDSHTAFLLPLSDPNLDETEIEKEAKVTSQNLRDEVGQSHSPDKTGDARKSDFLQRQLAKAKEAGSVIVARAKKSRIPRGASLPRLRPQAGQATEDNKEGMARTKSAAVQKKNTNIKPTDFEAMDVRAATSLAAPESKEIPSQEVDAIGVDENCQAPPNGKTDKREQSAVAVGTGPTNPEMKRKEATTPPVHQKKTRSGATSSREQGKKGPSSSRRKNKPLPEFVTVQRIIRRVREDGSVEVIRKQIRLKPLQVLPNGDVVVRRTLKRMKDDGSGFELLTVTQVIPRRKTKKRSTEPDIPEPNATEIDANDTSSLPDLATIRRPNNENNELDELIPKPSEEAQNLMERAFSMPSSSVISKNIARQAAAQAAEQAAMESQVRRSRSQSPVDRGGDRAVRFRMPRSSSASAVEHVIDKKTGGRKSWLGLSERSRSGNLEQREQKDTRRSRGRFWPLAVRVLSMQKNESETPGRRRGFGRYQS